MTLHYLSRKGSENAAKHNKDPKEHTRKLTHLYLNDQYIDSIGDISACRNLKVLYLQNNQLQRVENLEFATQLTHLYLQRNNILKMNGFDGLVALQKLYLGHNSISVVEGLENLKCLQELHVEHQKLCPGEEIMFDPRSIAALGYTLNVLNLQGNGLTSLEDLVGLDRIRILLVSSNNLKDVTKLQAFLNVVPTLEELDMRDNPVVLDYKNCNRILASAHNLRVFNGRKISVVTLDFMKKFEEHQKKVSACPTLMPSSQLVSSISELAHNLPEALAKDVTSSIFREASRRNDGVGEKEAELSSSTELALSVQSNAGSFFHFPAFKSSTCLHYDGHTIPKPFHRHILSSAQLGKKAQFSRKMVHCPFSVLNKIEDLRSNMEVVCTTNQPENDVHEIVRADCGDMVWDKNNSIIEPGKKEYASGT